MARDNNNANPDDYNALVKDNSGQNSADSENNDHHQVNDNSIGHTDAPRREENQFSLKHFLKRDSSLIGPTTTSSVVTVNTTNSTNINHSRSTSNINGNNNLSSCNSVNTASPSKSATTSSLHNNTTGARPKIPQFQSVNTLSSESKMKRSPRFPSFDSQSSLSDLGEDKFMSNIFHSRSNNSFNSEYPMGGGSSGGGIPSSNSSQYVQRSYSNYDMESPGSNSPQLIGSSQNLHNSPRSRENLNVIGGGGHRMGNSEFSAALPDFVQDHLVMEQWYNTIITPKSVSPVSVEFENLPDFTVNNIDPELTSRIHPANDMPFDLTYNSNTSARNRTPIRNSSPTIPLDLPPSNLDISFDLPRRRSPPVDMPPDLTENNASGMSRGGPSFGGIPIYEDQQPIADSIQRLPDFLYDGPIHSGRLDLSQDTPHFSSPDNNNDSRLQMENERLRRELEDNRRIMAEQTRRILELEKALEAAKISESQYNATIAQSMEENLDKSYLRAATAESLVNKLKQKVKKLTTEVESLRCENESLKEGAVGGAGVRTTSRYNRTQELSRELRLAASTAENNLRQLLTGVDNLRLMAASIENIDHNEIHHLPDDFLSSDSDDNDASGKAL